MCSPWRFLRISLTLSIEWFLQRELPFFSSFNWRLCYPHALNINFISIFNISLSGSWKICHIKQSLLANRYAARSIYMIYYNNRSDRIYILRKKESTGEFSNTKYLWWMIAESFPLWQQPTNWTTLSPGYRHIDTHLHKKKTAWK